jgi:hypothetical protein
MAKQSVPATETARPVSDYPRPSAQPSEGSPNAPRQPKRTADSGNGWAGNVKCGRMD